MPILSNRSKSGQTYTSPMGLEDVVFAELDVLNQHYVHQYGRAVREALDRCERGKELVRAGEIVQDLLDRKTTGAFGRSVGKHSLRLAVYAVLRWMERLGEIEQIPGRGWRVLTLSPEVATAH